MTLAELVRQYFPDASDDDVDYIIWEHTGYPEFFHTTKSYPTALSVLRRQLRAFKRQVAQKRRR